MQLRAAIATQLTVVFMYTLPTACCVPDENEGDEVLGNATDTIWEH